jgi:hypothetical protein
MQFDRRMRAARAAAARDRDQGMVAVSTASTWPELKLETSTVPLGAAVMSRGNRPAGIWPTIAGRPSSASATLITGGTFTVHAEVRDGGYVRVEVRDQGGPWNKHPGADGRPHGLAVVRDLAAGSGTDSDA